MGKRTLSAILFLGLAGRLCAMTAPEPAFPYPTGDLLGFDERLASLGVVRTELFLDLSGRPEALSRVRYEVANPGAGDVTAVLNFITPYAKSVSVTVNQGEMELAFVWLKAEQTGFPSLDAFRAAVYRRRSELAAVTFPVTFPAGSKTIIAVSFRCPSVPGKGAGSEELYPAEIIHLGPALDAAGGGTWFIFNFTGGGFFKPAGSAAVTVLAPENDSLESNAMVSGEGAVPGRLTRYVLTLDPAVGASFLEVKLTPRTTLRPRFGGTFALGFVTDWVGYCEFMLQALLDFYFYNHEFEAGLEGNPFGSEPSLKAPLLYTLFFGGKADVAGTLAGGISISAGALFVICPVERIGFRLGVAVALGFRFEMAFDFYPFGETDGFDWQMTFLFLKLSV